MTDLEMNNEILPLSIVFTHWAMNEQRSQIMRMSIESVINTAPMSEIIVCDNGGNLEDSKFLLSLTDSGSIASYTRYRTNMQFPFARNDGLMRASRQFIAITDNDILYSGGWAEECINFLNRNQGPYLATPIKTDQMNNRSVRWVGNVGGWNLNTRAGSNSFMMRRRDFETIGFFENIPKSGSKWVDRFNRMGYAVGVMPEPKALDMGFRLGFDLTSPMVHTIM